MSYLSSWPAAWATTAFLLLVLYIRFNDRRLLSFADRIGTRHERLTREDIKAYAEKYANSQPKDIKTHLPPKTGRRYIVIGGVSLSSITHWESPIDPQR